ncbi:unnamed protein product, partial [Closterium sp. NIES-53]
VPSRREPRSLRLLREWCARRCCRGAGGAAGAAAAGVTSGGAGGAAGAGAAGAAGPGGAGAGGTGNVGGPAGVDAAGGAGAASPGGNRTGGTGAAGTGGAARVGAVGAGAVPTGGAVGAIGGPGAGRAVGVVAGDPGAEGTGAVFAVFWRRCTAAAVLRSAPSAGSWSPTFYWSYSSFTECTACPVIVNVTSRPGSPVRPVCTSRRVPRQRPPPVPGTHSMTLHPSTAPLRVPLPSPPTSSLSALADPESDSLRTARPNVTLVELVDFAAHYRLDYAASLFAKSESTSVCPPSVGGERALGTDVLEDRQEEFECFAASVPHLVSMLLAPEGGPDAPDILTLRSYAEAIEGPYSSQWQAAMDAEMASWKSTRTYVDEVPPPGANIVSGMWIFRRDYELHSLDFSTAFLQGSLHEEIWLRRPPGFTGSFPAGTQWSLRRPVYNLRQAPCEWHDTLRTTLAALGFAPSTADPSLSLRTDATLSPFYVLVYVDDLVFATADTEALAHVLQRFCFTYSSPQSTPLPTGHSLSAPPSDESVEPSGPYPELVGCLMNLMTCTRPDLAYPLSLLARYVAPGRHQKVHWDAAKRVLRYLCSTSGMGLVLGGWARVVLTGHADVSWVDDLATQRPSQGYTFSLGSGSVSWQSARSSSVLSSSCEAEIYAGAMAAQELRWLTYLLMDLVEAPRSPPVLTKHIALRDFLARDLQQRGQLRLAYVACRANTADVFTKALQPCDHQRFCTVLGLVPTLPHLLTS